MSKRIERHRHMAEKYLTEHQAMTRAHVEGRTPLLPTAIQTGPIEFYIPSAGRAARYCGRVERPAGDRGLGADRVGLARARKSRPELGDVA